MHQVSRATVPTVAIRAGAIAQRALVALAVIGLTLALAMAGARPSVAAPKTLVDVDPDDATVAIGTTVTLTAWVRNDDGTPVSGSTHVRWFFASGNPNDPGSPGGSPDLQCWTDGSGSCSVTYLAVEPGTDTICATVGGAWHMCDQSASDPDWDDHSDTVIRRVTDTAVAASTPSPTPTPSPSSPPSPTPSPASTPSATPTPSASPTASPAPGETQPPSPSPTPSPSPSPSPSATASPTPSDTPALQAPTPSSSPTPTPSPKPTPSGSAAPTPSPTPSGDAVPSLVDHPAPPGDLQPAPAPTPKAASAPPLVEPPAVGPAVDRPGPLPVVSSGGAVDREPLPRSAGPRDVEPPSNPASQPVRVPASVAGGGLEIPALVAQAMTAAIDGVTTVVRPEVAAMLVEEFGFPLALAIAVVVYLVVQHYADRRDPKLRLAPPRTAETHVPFVPEGEL